MGRNVGLEEEKALMAEVDDFGFLADQIGDPETQWSMGTFGAIAEFVRDDGEPVELSRETTSISAVTDRGGVRLKRIDAVRLIAFETTTRESWSQRVGLCLPEDKCHLGRRSTLTEIGPDTDALRDEYRDGVLFDLGLSAQQADICIRTSDPELVRRLRSNLARSLFEPENPAIGIIAAASPHRVFITRVGRIEVFQPIPTSDGKSPVGPHTHLLPDLLRHRRTHAATDQIPAGWVPCAYLYPAHPARDELGKQRPFDGHRHAAFQEILRRFGDPRLVAMKDQVVSAVLAGREPFNLSLPDSRFARANVRVALRQLLVAGTTSPSLPAWITAHESAHRTPADGSSQAEQ